VLLGSSGLLLFLIVTIVPTFLQRHTTYTEGPRIEQPALAGSDFDCNLWVVLQPSSENQLAQHIGLVWQDAQHDRGSEVRPG
jgi:hypothetical protein